MDIIQRLPKQVISLSKRLTEEQLEEKVKAEFAKFNNLARRAIKQSVNVGIALLALHDKTPHGGVASRFEAIGITKSAAYRFMDLGRDCELVLAALDRAPDLTLDGCTKIINEHKMLRLPSDMPWDERAAVTMETVKKKKAKRGDDRQAERAVSALKKAIADIQDLVSSDPQGPEAQGAVAYLQTQARMVKLLHEEAMLKDTGPRDEDEAE